MLWLTVVAFLILIGVASVALSIVTRELRAARDSYTAVLRTREMLEQVRIVLSTLQDAETGERGFLLTGREDFLAPYHAAEHSLARELSRLNRLAGDAEARQIAAELAQLAQTQLQFVREVVALQRTAGGAAAIERVRTGTGKRYMDGIRELIAALESHEKKLLSQRFSAFERRSQRLESAVRIALAGVIFLIVATGALLLRHAQQRLRAEHAAGKALALLRSTMDNVTQGVAVFDSRQRLVAWNARYLDLRGVDPAQVYEGKPWDELLRDAVQLAVTDPTGAPHEGTAVPAVMAAGTRLEVEGRRADGAMLQIRGQRMSDGHYIITYTDVTALKLSETAYRDQATRLSAILDNVVDAIVTINESGSVESWNRGAERLFGYPAAEILRRNVRVLMPDPHASAHDGYIRRFLQTGERRIIGRRREVEALHKNGRRIPVDLGISEMHIGARRLFIGVLRDLSSRQEIEQLKSGFVSTVSHELRTPLTSISGSLGLLAGGIAGTLPPKATRLIDIAKLNCERLVRLINDILDLERAESGRLGLRLEEQPLRALVQHAVEANRDYARGFGVSIELVEGGDASVLVDRDRLMQVLTNILSNAAKFSPRGEVVRVFVHVEQDHVRVAVEDRGPGIAPDFEPRIFQRFAQADSSDSRAKGGTGLGLSIAKTLMERLGGSISFQSVHGRGTTFSIALPIRREQAPAVRSASEVSTGPLVLVCEDDPDVARALLRILKSEGMRGVSVPSAREAKAELARSRYDVALVDLHLSDGDGLELVTDLRESEATRSLPVIVITARARSSDDASRVGALQLVDWLQKPIDPRRLLDTIREVMMQLRGRRARILHVEDDQSLTALVNELLLEEADVVAAHSLAQARLRIESGQYDLVILDIALGDGSGLDVLPILRQRGRAAPPVILYSATEPSHELSNLVQAALVKSRDSVEQLLVTVRKLANARVAPEGT